MITRPAGVSRLNMWPFKDVYGIVAPFRVTFGLVATRASYHFRFSAHAALFAFAML